MTQSPVREAQSIIACVRLGSLVHLTSEIKSNCYIVWGIIGIALGVLTLAPDLFRGQRCHESFDPVIKFVEFGAVVIILDVLLAVLLDHTDLMPTAR